MNKKIYLLPLLLLGFIFVSCEETTESTLFDNWRPRNEAFLDSLTNVYESKSDPELRFFLALTDPSLRIYYKKQVANETGAIPLFTDSVNVYYRGSYIFGQAFEQNFAGKEPNLDFDVPSTYFLSTGKIKSTLSTTTSTYAPTGWTEALQRMRVGERWTIYLPWQMAYGTEGYENIPGYSVLIYDLQLLEILDE